MAEPMGPNIENEGKRFSRRTLIKSAAVALGTLGGVISQRSVGAESSNNASVPPEQANPEWPIFPTPPLEVPSHIPPLKMQYPPEWPPSITTNDHGVQYIKFTDPNNNESIKANMRIFAEIEDEWGDNLKDYAQYRADEFIWANGNVSELEITDSQVAGLPSKKITAKTPNRESESGQSVFKGVSYIGEVLYVNGQPVHISFSMPLDESDEPLGEKNFGNYVKALASLNFETS